MFIIDREKLKAHISNFIYSQYVSINRPYNNDEFSRVFTDRIGDMIKDAIEYNVKTIVNNTINELIDKMYTADDFEKDIGLR